MLRPYLFRLNGVDKSSVPQCVRYWNFPSPDPATGEVSGPEGAVLYLDGSGYYGPLVSSMREGFGIFFSADGVVWEGHWHEDRLEGKCVVVRPDSTRSLCKYSKGELVGEDVCEELLVRSDSPPFSLHSSCSSSEDLRKASSLNLVEMSLTFGSRSRLRASKFPSYHNLVCTPSSSALNAFLSTSSSVYVPRPPSRAETWLVPFEQLRFENRLSPLRACAKCPTVFKGLWLGKDVVIRTYSNAVLNGAVLDLLSKMARVRHPNICLFMAASATEDKVCIVTEFVSSGSLNLHLSSALSAQNVLHLARGIAVGCAYLRKSGFAHKNLKPSNILVDAAVDVKLTDYFAKEFADIFHPVCLSPDAQYVAPESLRQTPFRPYGIDTASDVYSFGLILWEMTAGGRRPYQNLSVPQLRVVVGFAGYREPRVSLGTLRSLGKMIERCTHQDPSKRSTFERLVLALSSLHSSANSAAEDALITFISGR